MHRKKALGSADLSGVYTALVTPFRGGEVDLGTFRALCERQIDAGVSGLVPCGTTGETPTLSEEEWASVVRAAVEVSSGRVPVIAGCGSNSTAHTVHALAAARALGADAGLVVFPYYNKPNPPGMKAHVAALVQAGLPVVLYHVPGRTGQRLPVSQLADLCEMPGIIGVKEATGDVTYDLEFMLRYSGAVLSGDDFTFGPLMAFGAAGVISVLSNVAPALTVQWAEACRGGDVAQMRALNATLFPVVQYLFAEVNPVPVKMAMAEMGLIEAEFRLPLAPGNPPPAGLLDGLG